MQGSSPRRGRFTVPPLLLGARIDALAPGNSGAPRDLLGLKNPSGRGMEILEIVWRFRTDYTVGFSLLTKLDLGEIPITNGFIPTLLFCRNDSYDTSSGDGDGTHLRWKLPKPLYIPPGGVLAPTFKHSGLSQDALTVDLAYIAREVRREPKTAQLPYVTAFTGKAFQGSTTYDSSASDPTDLLNPFEQPLKLQRMTGRVFMYYIYNAAGVAPTVTGYLGSPEGYVEIDHITDSKGRPWIQNACPFYTGIFYGDQSWELDGAALEPQTFLDVRFNYTGMGLLNAFPGPLDYDPFIHPMLGLIGHREVSL